MNNENEELYIKHLDASDEIINVAKDCLDELELKFTKYFFQAAVRKDGVSFDVFVDTGNGYYIVVRMDEVREMIEILNNYNESNSLFIKGFSHYEKKTKS